MYGMPECLLVCLIICMCRYDDLFRLGEHYETFRYDLSDVVERSKELLDRFNKSDPSLSTMAKHASDTAVKVFNFYGQLDALVYAALKVGRVQVLVACMGFC